MGRRPRDRETDRAALTAAATRLLAGTPCIPGRGISPQPNSPQNPVDVTLCNAIGRDAPERMPRPGRQTRRAERAGAGPTTAARETRLDPD